MNQLAFIDYQRPIGSRNDYRSATYRGHVYMDDTMLLRSKERSKVDCKAFRTASSMHDEFVGEHQRHYTRKYPDPNFLRNPPLTGKTVKFMKNFEENHLRSAPRSLKELRSVYSNDFRAEPQVYADDSPTLNARSAVKTSDTIPLERTKPGYAKYLDTSATSNRLDYLSYTPEQRLGIAAHDNITFWTWTKKGSNVKRNVWPIKEQVCDKFSANKCPKRRNEFRSLRKAVPNAGLTTETKSSYLKPLSGIEFNFKCPSSELMHCDIVPSQKKTENSIYGSGERLERFIHTGVKRRSL